MAADDVSLAAGAVDSVQHGQSASAWRVCARTYQSPLAVTGCQPLHKGAGTKQQTLLTQAISLAPVEKHVH